MFDLLFTSAVVHYLKYCRSSAVTALKAAKLIGTATDQEVKIKKAWLRLNI